MYIRRKIIRGRVVHQLYESRRRDDVVKKRYVGHLGPCSDVEKAIECAKECGDKGRVEFLKGILPKIKKVAKDIEKPSPGEIQSMVERSLDEIRRIAKEQQETNDRPLVNKLYWEMVDQVRELMRLQPERVKDLLLELFPGYDEGIEGLLEDAQKS